MIFSQLWIRVLVIVSGMIVAVTCAADSWSLPTEATYTSADGRWRLTVTPRSLSSQLAYFEDKVAGKGKAGGLPGDNQEARGLMQKRTEQGWTTIWKKNLLNDVAPVDVLVSSAGQVVTLDNWHTMGHGDDTVVVYSVAGLPICSLGLYDLLPAVVVDNLPRSVSSIQWRVASRFSSDDRILMLTIASPHALAVIHGRIDRAANAFELGLRMSDCAVIPPSAEIWHEVVSIAEQSKSDAEKQWAARRAEFIAPLKAPRDDNPESWNRYLNLAWHRSSTKSDGYPRIQNLIPTGRPGHEDSLTDLKEELQLLTQWSDVLVIGSGSPRDLVLVIREFTATIPRDALQSKQVFLALPDTDFSMARDALLPTGADVVQIDPTIPLPQSEGNLRGLVSDELAHKEEVAERARHARGRAGWWVGY